MKKKLFLVIVIGIMAVALCGCCSHEWEEATCTEPETCSLCDKTKGNPLGHEDSEYGDWEIDAENAIYVKEKYCQRCEDFYDRQEGEEVTSFIENGVIMISPNSFANCFDKSVMNGYEFESEVVYDDTKLFYDDNYKLFYEIENNDISIGMYSFIGLDGETLPHQDNFSSESATGINILIEKTSDVSAVVFATVLAIDPALSYDESADVGQSIVDNVGNMDGTVKNSIKYTLYKDGGYHYLLVTAL